MKYYGQIGFQTDKRLMVFGSEYVKMINTNF